MTSMTDVTAPDGTTLKVYMGGPKNKYRYVFWRGKTMLAARVVFEACHGREPIGNLRYLDGDPSNLSVDNLEENSVLSRIAACDHPVKIGNKIVDKKGGGVLATDYKALADRGLVAGFFPVVLLPTSGLLPTSRVTVMVHPDDAVAVREFADDLNKRRRG